jgi:Uma2 family endonuclease
MGPPQQKTKLYTPEEYLRLEREAEFRHEYLNGEIFEMAGAGKRHNQISVNLIHLIVSQIRERQCAVYGSGMRIKIPNENYKLYLS